MADSISRDYINNYLSQLNENEIYTQKNIMFIQDFLSADDKYFDLFYSHRERIDNTMNEKGYAQKVIDRIIYGEKIYPGLKIAHENSTQPDWNSLLSSVKNKYSSDDAHRNILSAKMKWSEFKQN